MGVSVFTLSIFFKKLKIINANECAQIWLWLFSRLGSIEKAAMMNIALNYWKPVVALNKCRAVLPAQTQNLIPIIKYKCNCD